MGRQRILVTGVSGLLGLNFSLQFCDAFDIVGALNRNALNNAPFPFIQKNFTQAGFADKLIDEAKPDAILHCAALANIDFCERNPDDARKMNGVVPGVLAEAAAKRSIPFLSISTDAVFDGQHPNPGGYRESDTPNPINVYAATKLMGERSVLSANAKAIVARVNFYGWSISGQRSLSEFFYQNLKAGRVVSGFTDVYFSPLYVHDLARILVKFLASEETGLIHVFGSRVLSKYEFGVEIANAFGFDPAMVHPTSWRDSGLTAVRSPNLIMNIDRLTKFLGGNVPDGVQGLAEFRADLAAGLPERIRGYRWN